MVVLGGTGTLWGPLIGGFLYWYANQRLVAVGGSHAMQSLPSVLRTPLSQPLFVLGDAVHPRRLLPAGRDRRASARAGAPG